MGKEDSNTRRTRTTKTARKKSGKPVGSVDANGIPGIEDMLLSMTDDGADTDDSPSGDDSSD